MNDDLRDDFDFSEGELCMVVSLTLSSLRSWGGKTRSRRPEVSRDAVDGQQRLTGDAVPF